MECEESNKSETRSSGKAFSKFRKSIFAFLALIAAILACNVTLNILDPVIEGRRASRWVFDFYYKNDPQSVSIIRKMDDEGLKLLLKSGLKLDPPWVQFRRYLPGILHEYIPEKVDHSTRIQMIYNRIILHSDFFEPHAEHIGIWLNSDDPEAEIQGISLLRYFPSAARTLQEKVYRQFASDPACFQGGLTLLKSINFPTERLVEVIKQRLSDPDYRIRARAVRAGFDLGMNISFMIDPMESVIRKGPFDAVSEVLGIAIQMGPKARPLKDAIEDFIPTISDMSSVPAGLAQNALKAVSTDQSDGNDF